MSRESMTALMGDLSEALGIEGLALEEDHCRLQAQGEELTLDLDYVEEGELVVLSCPLGPVAAERREAVMAAFLSANCFWQGTGGRTLSLDAAGEGLLQAQVPLGGLDFPAFYKALEGFAASGEQWIDRLRDLNQGAAEDAEPAAPAAPPPDAGMIRG